MGSHGSPEHSSVAEAGDGEEEEAEEAGEGGAGRGRGREGGMERGGGRGAGTHKISSISWKKPLVIFEAINGANQRAPV